MGKPESEVRCEGKCVQQTLLGAGSTNLDNSPRCGRKIGEVLLGVKERSGLRASSRGEGYKDGSKLGLELFLDALAAMGESAENGGRPSGQDLLVGDHEKFLKALGLFGCIQQVRLGCEGKFLQILKRADRFRVEA